MKSPSRIGLVHLALAAFALALLVRVGERAAAAGRAGGRRARSTSRAPSATIPAPRGDILDAQGERWRRAARR